jgi:hypothetical protein
MDEKFVPELYQMPPRIISDKYHHIHVIHALFIIKVLDTVGELTKSLNIIMGGTQAEKGGLRDDGETKPHSTHSGANKDGG